MQSPYKAGQALRDFLNWIKRANSVETLEEATEVDKGFTNSLKDEDVLNWKRGKRLITDTIASQEPPSIRGEAPKFIGNEVYTEHIESGVRISVFYDFEGNLIGRAYFDRGDLSIKEVQQHLKKWEAVIKPGRPREGSPLPLADDEIFEFIESRNDWYVHGDEGKEYQVTPRDAAEQLAANQGLVHDYSSDDEIEDIVNTILRAYERVRKRPKEN